MTALDGAGSNPRTERAIMKDRDPAWAAVSFQCESHLMFHILSAVGNDFCSKDISGQIHWALSFEGPFVKKHASEILRDVVADWLEVVREPAPPSARRRLRALMMLLGAL